MKKLKYLTEKEFQKIILILIKHITPKELKSSQIEIIDIFKNDGGCLVDYDVIIGCDFECNFYHGQLVFKECGSIVLRNNIGSIEEPENIPKVYQYLINQGYKVSINHPDKKK